jgi:F-box protein 9
MSMTAAEEQETEELRDFRENWKREVREKQRLQQSSPDSADPTAASSNQASGPDSEAKAHPHSSRLQSLNDALEVYGRAVKHEQASELDEALRLYRQAFRMDSNVDRAYHLREQRTSRAPEIPHGAETATSVRLRADNRVAGSIEPEVDDGVVHVKPPSLSSHHHPERQISGLLARIVADFPLSLSFEPEDEKEPSYLQRLPDELLVHILSYLGVSAIECFARVSRKARIVTLDTIIWRSGFSFFLSYLCAESIIHIFRSYLFQGASRAQFSSHISYRSFVETIYKPPQISPDEELDDIVDSYSSDYRRVYIERPHVRLDGVYIAVCHYMYLLVNVVHPSYHSLNIADDKD